MREEVPFSSLGENGQEVRGGLASCMRCAVVAPNVESGHVGAGLRGARVLAPTSGVLEKIGYVS